MTTIESWDTFPSIPADTTGLPYAVRRRGLELAYILMFSVMGLAIGAVTGWQAYREPSSVPPLFEAGFAAWALGSVYILAMLPRPYLIFYPDRFEKRGLTGWRTVHRSDIVGIRPSGSDRTGAMFQVVEKQPGAQGVRLHEALRKDPIIARWFKGVHDLNAEAIAADKSALLNDPRYGATPAQREGRLKQAKTVAIAFNVVCVAIGVGIYFTSGYNQLRLAAAVLPPLAGVLLIRLFDGLIVWNASGKARPGIPGAWAPLFAVTISALNLHILDERPLLIAATIGGVAVATIWMTRPSANSRWIALPATAVMAGLAAYGLIALCDVALDASKPQTFPLMVKDRDIRGSRNRSYNIYVDRWSDQPGGQVSVDSDYYARLSIGSTVCIFRRPGALGMAWFDVADCPAGIKPPPPPRIATATPSTGPASSPRPRPARAPSDPFYPQRAADLGKEGRAVVRCRVAEGPKLTDCHVLSETPPDFGFGDAAARRLTRPQLPIKPEALRGHTTVDIPVNFKLTN